jgi:hypothetical protein
MRGADPPLAETLDAGLVAACQEVAISRQTVSDWKLQMIRSGSHLRAIPSTGLDRREVGRIAISVDRWLDNVRLPDLEPHFACQACGRRGADVRSDRRSVDAFA